MKKPGDWFEWHFLWDSFIKGGFHEEEDVSVKDVGGGE